MGDATTVEMICPYCQRETNFSFESHEVVGVFRGNCGNCGLIIQYPRGTSSTVVPMGIGSTQRAVVEAKWREAQAAADAIRATLDAPESTP